MRANVIVETFPYEKADILLNCPNDNLIDFDANDYTIVFIAFPTSSSSSISTKVINICESLEMRLVEIPETLQEAETFMEKCKNQI